MKEACMALLSPAVGRTERLSAWNEVFALVLLFAGTLLFFALISYTPNDIPSWFWFSHVSPANHPAQNFIGPLGAIVAGICYQLIGVFASLLLAAVLLGFGAAKLFYPRLRFAPRIPWIVLFLISGACLDQAWGISHLLGRKVPVDIQGPGGLIGYRLSDEHRGLLPAALGPVGSVLLLVAVYLTTLILVTGLRPIHLVREMVNLTRRSVAKQAEWRVRRRIRKSDLTEQLKTQKQRRALEALQKELKKKGVPVPDAVATTFGAGRFASSSGKIIVGAASGTGTPFFLSCFCSASSARCCFCVLSCSVRSDFRILRRTRHSACFATLRRVRLTISRTR